MAFIRQTTLKKVFSRKFFFFLAKVYNIQFYYILYTFYKYVLHLLHFIIFLQCKFILQVQYKPIKVIKKKKIHFPFPFSILIPVLLFRNAFYVTKLFFFFISFELFQYNFYLFLLFLFLVQFLLRANEIDFEFIFDYNFLIQLNINSIYFMVSYSDFIIFNFYEYHFL